MPAFELTSPDGKKYRVEGPEGATPEQAYGILQQQLASPQSTWDKVEGEALGAAKGVGQGLSGVLLQVPGLGTPSVGDLDPRAKKWTEEPSANVGQSIGKVVGGALPFAIGGPEAMLGKGVAEAIPFFGKMAGPLGELAGNALVGGAAGAAQPPDPNQSRWKNAVGGAVGGALASPRIAGAISGVAGGAGAGYGLEQLIRQFGWEPVIGAMGGALGYGGLHGGLYNLARHASKLATYPGKVISNYLPAGVAGSAGAAASSKAQQMMNDGPSE